MEQAAFIRSLKAKAAVGGGSNIQSNCIQFVVDTTDGTGFNMEFTSDTLTGFTITYGDGDSLTDTVEDDSYEISHTYPEEGQQYTAKLCFDNPGSITRLEFYGND